MTAGGPTGDPHSPGELLGVMNTMLMATYERIQEFGVLKALGTSPGRIIRDVAAEALMLGLLAALLGVTVGAYCHFRSKAYREIHVDDQALRVVTRTGESLHIAWDDVLRANHLDNMGVWFRWQIVSNAGVEIRIAEAGLSRPQWWRLFHKISDHLPRPSELPWSESK